LKIFCSRCTWAVKCHIYCELTESRGRSDQAGLRFVLVATVKLKKKQHWTTYSAIMITKQKT